MLSRIINKLFPKLNSVDAPKQLAKYGDEALSAFNAVGDKLGIFFMPMLGTLLGAYREHGFIKFDTDVDVICNIKHLTPELLDELRNQGFEIQHLFVSSDFKGVQMPMKYKGLVSDIYFTYENKKEGNFYFYLPLPIKGYDWSYSHKWNLFSVKRIILPIFYDYCDCKMNNNTVKIPINSDEILKSIYGETFMTPIKNSHANPPIEYYGFNEKKYTLIPIEIFEEYKIIDRIIKE